ncbi:MAG: acetylglutamate kinase, partial [Propionibacteriaceae bacterium]|nr:acetylglutamate kinase [Propionibacteriaceae bacterium]
RVRPAAVIDLIDAGRVPVIATVAPGEEGDVYNVNADTAAAALAVALGARRLVMLTDVPGLYADWPASTQMLTQIFASELEALLPNLESGMRPKMQACLQAVRGGVRKATVLDGRVPHALLLEVFTNDGIGTLVLADEEADDE